MGRPGQGGIRYMVARRFISPDRRTGDGRYSQPCAPTVRLLWVGVGQSTWSFHTSGVVNASPESVFGWWFHPDRKADLLGQLESSGALSLTLEDVFSDGVRIRAVRWTEKNGWKHRHDITVAIVPGQMPELIGDRFVIPASEVRTYTPRNGARLATLTSKCEGRIEFIPQHSNGTTEVAVVHNHSMSGFPRRRRLRVGASEQVKTESAFQSQIEYCRQAISER